MFIVWQKKYLQKHDQLIEIGQRLMNMQKLQTFVEENIDMLYDNRDPSLINMLKVDPANCN